MSKLAKEIQELSAACLMQPGVGALLKATLGLMRTPGAAPDLDPLFGVLDPTRYDDGELAADVAQFLYQSKRPDLARRWSSRAAELAGGAPDPAEVASGPAPELPITAASSAGSGPRLAVVPPPADDSSGEVLRMDRFRQQNSAAGDEPRPRARERVGLDDVEGLAPVKAQIRRRIIQPFQAEGLYARFKRKAGGGVLMYGPPGCGKTMLARATAEECKATFMPVEISEILSRYVGDSEKRMKSIFDSARRQAPTILFFDEVEALARKRSFGDSNSVDSMVSVFLNVFDGLQHSNEGVLVLAATNVPWSVDAAFRRPGRFDRTLFVPPPDREARAAILTKALANVPHIPGLDVASIAQATPGYSGADLAELVATASDIAIDESLARDSLQPITIAHLKEALTETRATTLEWLTTARNYAEYANRDGAWDELAEFLRKHV